MAFSLPIDVRFADLDALGHVNHAAFVVYLEHARTQWWRAYLAGRGFTEEGFVIARVELDYRRPAHLGDDLRVELRCVELGQSSFTLAYRVLREPGAVLLAEGRTVQVMMDFAGARPEPLRPPTRTWLEGQA